MELLEKAETKEARREIGDIFVGFLKEVNFENELLEGKKRELDFSIDTTGANSNNSQN